MKLRSASRVATPAAKFGRPGPAHLIQSRVAVSSGPGLISIVRIRATHLTPRIVRRGIPITLQQHRRMEAVVPVVGHQGVRKYEARSAPRLDHLCDGRVTRISEYVPVNL